MSDEEEGPPPGRSSPEWDWDALYRATISCAGLLFLFRVRPLGCLLLSMRRDARERDMDHVLSASSASSSASDPRKGSVLKTIP